MAFSINDSNYYRRYIEEMMRQQERQMKQDMYQQQYGFVQSGVGVSLTAEATPETPKHLNRKLLLTKGA